ncbi:MAG: hypothetical protein KGZ30_00425 [Anaplasmataceae bacterium]|nr:hypothetical protein [Anaplasmataceae bacterium]
MQQKNPYLNAFLAAAYILLVVFVMNNLMKAGGPEDSALAPVAFLSMLTLSVAVMGYLFFLEPVVLYLDGKKKEAMTFLGKTILSFGVLTVLVVLVVYLGII